MSGMVNRMNLDVTVEQIEQWKGGDLIQDVMPHLSRDEREFLITGMTPDEWDLYLEGISDE
jgi:hypothetical protein